MGGSDPQYTPPQTAGIAAQTAANQALTGIAQSRNAREEKAFNKVYPFYSNRMDNGLPFFNALTDYQSGPGAQAWGLGRARLNQGLLNQGMYPEMGSGFAAQANIDYEAQRARAFDQALQNILFANETSRQQGAQGIMGQQQLANPFAPYGLMNFGNLIGAQPGIPGQPGIGGQLLGGGLTGLINNAPWPQGGGTNSGGWGGGAF